MSNTEYKSIQFNHIVSTEPEIPGFIPVYKGECNEPLPFSKDHFIQAMENVIKLPNINSTIILRADILSIFDSSMETPEQNDELIAQELNPEYKTLNINDIEMRLNYIPKGYHLLKGYVRRMYPRNPFKDRLINQTCLILQSDTNEDDIIINYTPHIDTIDEETFPFYIPNVKSINIHYKSDAIRCLYYSANEEQCTTDFVDPKSRLIRTSKKLLETACKHSIGNKNGYKKQTEHDKIISKEKFQDRYVLLKQKYGKYLYDNWCEVTDPNKHVFEEISIAAFLIELWLLKYSNIIYNKEKFQFKDLGCGNGSLVFILISEGIAGQGYDLRERKSWINETLYSDEIKENLKKQCLVPNLSMVNKTNFLIKNFNDDPISNNSMIQYNKEDVEKSSLINTMKWSSGDKITFIIGNHSDELTCWIPLLGYPFMVLPCCSYDYNAKKVRYTNKKENNYLNKHTNSNNGKSNSKYASLVNQVIKVSNQIGWQNIQSQSIRIPSTRNIAVVATEHQKLNQFDEDHVWLKDECVKIIDENDGCDDYVINCLSLIASQYKTK
ncbi:hypothetical protein ACO0OE_002888 [Hanseniaspora uvarum]